MHSARFPAKSSNFPGGLSGEGSREVERSAFLVDERIFARGIQKDLWPKLFPKCPVARHFVCPG